jgi:hypothetical protein
MCCFGSQTAKNAPCGSWMTPIRPDSITSKAGACAVPPSSLARSTAASALSTVTYEFQFGGAPASRCCCGWGEMAATSFPSTRCIE